MTDRQVGGVGARVDLVPQTIERQPGGLNVVVDYVPATGDVTSALGTLVDLRPTTSTRAGSVYVLVDVVVPTIVTVTGTAQLTLLGLTISATGTSTVQTTGTIAITLASLSIDATSATIVQGSVTLLLGVPLISALGTAYVIPPPPNPFVLGYGQARLGTATSDTTGAPPPIATSTLESEPPRPGTATGG